MKKLVTSESIAEFLSTAFSAVVAQIHAQNLTIAGPPFGRFRRADDSLWMAEAGFPVRGQPIGAGEVKVDRLPGGMAARTIHSGDYDAIANAHAAVQQWLRNNDYVPAAPLWEAYFDDPAGARSRTEVVQPCLVASWRIAVDGLDQGDDMTGSDEPESDALS